MRILIFTLWSLILAVCFQHCQTAPITNYDDRAFKRRRRPCGRDINGKTFGNAIFLGDVTITQVSCGGNPGGKPGIFSGQGIKPGIYGGNKPGIYGGNKPGGNKPGGGHGGGGGFLNSVFGDGGLFGGNGGIFSDGGFLGGGGGSGGGGSGAHTGGAAPGGSGGSGGGFGSGLGNILNNIFGGFRPQLPQIIGPGSPGGSGGIPVAPADPLPEDSNIDDNIPQDPVSEDPISEEEDPVKPVFEEIPEDPVTELYKPLPLVGATNQNVQGYSQDLSNFKPGKVINSIGRQFNHYLINPFVDLFTK